MYQLELIFKKTCNINSVQTPNLNNIYSFACISCNAENILDISYNNYKNIQWCKNCQKDRYVHFYNQK